MTVPPPPPLDTQHNAHVAQVEEDLERWVDAQIIKHDDKKWGNTLSQVR